MTEIDKYLEIHLGQHLPFHEFKAVLEYAVLPPGKLFRPRLVHAMANDLKVHGNDHALLGSFVEIHHAYTLVHDDLPSMDDDDIRRGKAATHKKFNEWKAILAGDALLNLSFGLLHQISPNKLPWLLKFASWTTGPKGLILGQVMDMGHESQQSLQQLLQMHRLKTSRLIQLSLVGSYYLSKGLNLTSYKDIMKLGNAMGLAFQLLDDLKEVALDEVNEHEKEVNPYFHYGEDEVLKLIRKQNQTIKHICGKYSFESVYGMYEAYWEKSCQIISKKIQIQ
jgi:geranylgeranyl pyrophosphate synthase